MLTRLVQYCDKQMAVTIDFFFVNLLDPLQREYKMSADPMPEIKSKHSLVAKFMSQGIWDKLSSVVTKVRPSFNEIV